MLQPATAVDRRWCHPLTNILKTFTTSRPQTRHNGVHINFWRNDEQTLQYTPARWNQLLSKFSGSQLTRTTCDMQRPSYRSQEEQVSRLEVMKATNKREATTSPANPAVGGAENPSRAHRLAHPSPFILEASLRGSVRYGSIGRPRCEIRRNFPHDVYVRTGR
jgi:hypothetical protein